MAAKETTSTSNRGLKKPTIKRKWRHAKKKKSQLKTSKNYNKSYHGQGR